MGEAGFSAPVLFVIFNRPDTTARVFQVIRQAKPARLYIAADGPREDKPGEGLKVQEVRAYVMGNIDWECEVKTLFRDKNAGCKRAVSGAINWFFENEEEGIILEDDCLPDVSFFRFCMELLEKYRHNERVMMISGNNFQSGAACSHSYYFSKYGGIWGWASWRRAWLHYDVNMRRWPQVLGQGALNMADPPERLYWRRYFDLAFSGRLNTWDYQWIFTCWMMKGLSVMPAINLVSNIGFGQDSTHTKKGDHYVVALPKEGLSFPLRHPEDVAVDRRADIVTRDLFYRLSVPRYVWMVAKGMIGWM